MNKLIKISCLGLMGFGLIAGGQALAVTQMDKTLLSHKLQLVPKFHCKTSKFKSQPTVTIKQISGKPLDQLQQNRLVAVLLGKKTIMLKPVCTSQFKDGKLVLKPNVTLIRGKNTFGTVCRAFILKRGC